MCLTREEVQQWSIISNVVDLPLSHCCTCPYTNGTTTQLHILVISICASVKYVHIVVFKNFQRLKSFEQGLGTKKNHDKNQAKC